MMMTNAANQNERPEVWPRYRAKRFEVSHMRTTKF